MSYRRQIDAVEADLRDPDTSVDSVNRQLCDLLHQIETDSQAMTLEKLATELPIMEAAILQSALSQLQPAVRSAIAATTDVRLLAQRLEHIQKLIEEHLTGIDDLGH